MTTARRPFTTCTLSIVIGLLCLSQSSAQLDPGSMAGIWLLDEGSGTIAKDSSGHAYDADLKGNPKWVKGRFGQALEFQGDSYLEIRDSAKNLAFGGVAPFSATAWVKNQGGGTLISKFNAGVIGAYIVGIGGGGTISFHREVAPWAYSGTKPLPSSDWGHAAVTYDGAVMKIYVNGVFDAQQDRGSHNTDTATPVLIGAQLTGGAPSQFFVGALDEVALFNIALTEDQIKQVMKGLATTAALYPIPEDGATDVPRDTNLGWTAPAKVATHNVYFGASREDVNAASTDAPRGVLVGKGQTETTYTPNSVLTYGQTYFWRVDEVNGPPDFTVFRGRIWSFTAEPYSYPLTGITATASSFEKTTTGPANTINGSGLTNDLHSIVTDAMWVSSMADAGPVWIRYAFDTVCKLQELWVWNHNTEMEPILGYGFKDVTIETSTDGTTWTLLKDMQFARATAVAGYAHNTTVDMGGVMAQYVRITAKSNWSTVGWKQFGLSEVRFFHVPVEARAPQPANDAEGVSVDSTLDWRPGRDAASHKVFFGNDKAAVTDGTATSKTVTELGFAPGALDFGTTYYWKVDEVGTATYPGALWSFTTQEYAAVDDFESYTDDEGSRVYETWVDGWTNGTGSVVGYLQAPFAETTVVHGGGQAMPFEYNNVKTPYYSEASRTFEATQDWTTNGADTLSLYFRGRPVGFADNGNNTFTMSAGGTDIWNNSDQFRFACKSLNGNGSIAARVDSVGNTNVWAKASVMIRETLDAGSKNACIAVTPGSGISFQWRDTVNGASANSATAALVAPYWVRITRTGNVFKAEYSADGKTWIQQGVDTTVVMATSVYIGLAVTSHDAALTTTAEISNVSATGTITGSWQAPAIGAAMVTNGPASLYLTVEDKTGKTKTVVNPNPSASAAGAWTQWQIPLSELTGGVNVAAVKKITLGVGDKASPKAGAAGMLYFDDIGYGHPAQ